MKKSSTSNAFSRHLASFLGRFHLTLFVLFVMTCVTLAVVLLNASINNQSETDDYTSAISAGSIDQDTLERVKLLTQSGNYSPAPLPEGRINPFGE
ncbi:hypothetical protein LRY29_00680 [Candidatus Saccharibacteria bacterium]|nr:hypothetical protein [Candidatus Saccharibacteria bacterium]